MPILNIKLKISDDVDPTLTDPQTLADGLVVEHATEVEDILEAEWEE